ncbi:unnamed protein product [Bursaphelenchus okinawaensis]|uniref:Uncharacterized protein n=1 Tax=Bursaphelenchus okinawaensis TaxID=465554 RepID=A0A811K762_9BILA|nr:unnamed protein product [Bursaphelenchus okinawaensis]CAG9093181.1 unnamed protein product [Bursaphelenchus okinawaensis]
MALLKSLTEFESVPSDFDYHFFKSLAVRLIDGDSLKLDDIYKLVKENLSNQVLLCAYVATLLYDDDVDHTLRFLSQNVHNCLRQAGSCSCLQQLLFDLALHLEKKKCLHDEVKDVFIDDGFTLLTSERSNVVIRRQIAHFLVEVAKSKAEKDTIVKQLYDAWAVAEYATIIDEVSFVLHCTDLFRSLDQDQCSHVVEKFVDLTRPSLNTVKFVANVLLLDETTIVKRLSEVEDQKSLSMLCSEVMKQCSLCLQPEILQIVMNNMRQTVDYAIEYIDEIEERFKEDMPKLQREINANLAQPKKCSQDSLIKYLNFMRLCYGVSSSEYVQALDAAKLRIQKTPEILDMILSDMDEYCELFRENMVKNIFSELTVNIITIKNFPNWILVDSAILILNKIGDFFDYDEELIHDRILELMKTREHEDVDYVRDTAFRFLLQHCPDMVKQYMKQFFVNSSNVDIRIFILERLLLASKAELPEAKDLDDIMDDVLMLESNLEVKEKALLLMEKLGHSDEHWKEKSTELRESIREDRTRQERRNDLEYLTHMIESVKTSCDCFDDHVAKECY